MLKKLLLFCFIGLTTFISSAENKTAPQNLHPDTCLKKAKYFMFKEVDSSEYYALRALNISKRLKDEPSQAKSLFFMGICKYLQNELQASFQYYSDALAMFKELNDSTGISHSVNNLGIIYEKLGDYKNASEYYLESLKIDEKIGEKKDISDSYTNIGLIFHKLDYDSKAEEYHQKALKLRKEINDTVGIAYSYNNIALLFEKREEFQTAIEYYRMALGLSKKVDDVQLRLTILINMSTYFQNISLIDSASTYNSRTIALARKAKNWDIFRTSRLNEADLLVQNKRPKEALIIFDSILVDARKEGRPDKISTTYTGMSEAYASLGDYKKAFEYFKDAQQIMDSIMFEKNNRQIAGIQLLHESEKTFKENELLKIENELQSSTVKNQQIIIYFTIGLLAVITFMAVSLFSKNKNKKKINSKLEKQYKIIEKNQEDLKALNNTKDKILSVIGHDLRNPIGNVKSFLDLIEESPDDFNKEDILRMIKTASESAGQSLFILDNLLSWSRAQLGMTVSEASSFKIWDAVETNIHLLKPMAEKKNIQIINKTDAKLLINADINMTQIILRNLISNAIKFTNPGGQIKIENSINNDKKEALIKIIDNGIGMTEEELRAIKEGKTLLSKEGTSKEKGNGIGLFLCREFIEKHHGKLLIESKKNTGSCFSFNMPISQI